MQRGEKAIATRGFTLLELLVILAIVVVLAAIITPIYQQYIDRTKFSEVIQHGDKLTRAVANCLQENQGDLTQCNGGVGSVPNNLTVPSSYIFSAEVTNSVITIVGSDGNGNATETITYTPSVELNGAAINWTKTGSACGKYIDC